MHHQVALQIATLGKACTALIAYVWLLSRMRSHVNTASTMLCEGPIAKLTLVWLLASVLSAVDFQCHGGFERLVTAFTRIAALSGVHCTLMFGHFPFDTEALPAVGTLVAHRRLNKMGTHVGLTGAFLPESPLALRALEGLFATVDELMPLQMTRSVEGGGADVALIPPTILVNVQMLLQVMLPLETCPRF